MEKRTTIFSIFVFLCLLTNSTYVPVVILYDAETKGSVALNFQLVPTDDFELGELTLRKGRYSYSNY